MPRIRRCTICNIKFVSRNGKEVCSEGCAVERIHLQNKAGNERRRNGHSNDPIEKVCPVCNKKFETLRNKYCSTLCSDLKRKEQLRENYYNFYHKVFFDK